jgi:hypothetical protein
VRARPIQGVLILLPYIVTMSGKTNVCADSGPKKKKKGKGMSLLENMQLLDKLDRRMRIAVVECHYFVNRVTIHFIKKSQDRIREYVKACVPSGANTFFVNHHDHILKKIE